MPSKSSLALISGAFIFIAFWGIGLASVEIDPTYAGVDANGYGISIARTVARASN